MQRMTGENILWASSWILWCTLVIVLYRRKLYRHMPMFFLWACEILAETTILFLISRSKSNRFYDATYWLFALVEIILQLAVAFEFSNKVLRRDHCWIGNSRIPFLIGVLGVLMLSIILTTFATPAATNSVDAMYFRLSLISSLSVLFVATVTFSLANWYGAFWLRGDFYRFSGFLVWAAASALTDTAHAYWRTASHFEVIDLVRALFSQSVVMYWIITAYVAPANAHAPVEQQATELLCAFKSGTIANGK